jgi:hypothetical protein
MSSFFAQIPKAQKRTDNLTVFFALSGFAGTKSARKGLVKLTRGDYLESNFIFPHAHLI